MKQLFFLNLFVSATVPHTVLYWGCLVCVIFLNSLRNCPEKLSVNVIKEKRMFLITFFLPALWLLFEIVPKFVKWVKDIEHNKLICYLYRIYFYFHKILCWYEIHSERVLLGNYAVNSCEWVPLIKFLQFVKKYWST